MDNKVEQCPKCGNYVEGKVIYSADEEVTRAVASKGTSSFLVALFGGLIGSFAFPIGTIIGFVLGLLISNTIGKGAAEAVGNEMFKDSDYLFSCPKCGHKWTRHLLKAEDTTTPEVLQKEKDDIINLLEESFNSRIKKMIYHLIFISLSFWWCYEHDFFWIIFIGPCIYSIISFFNQLRSLIIDKKERLELEEMTLEEFRGNKLRYKYHYYEY